MAYPARNGEVLAAEQRLVLAAKDVEIFDPQSPTGRGSAPRSRLVLVSFQTIVR
jgi:hypothetical protein